MRRRRRQYGYGSVPSTSYAAPVQPSSAPAYIPPQAKKHIVHFSWGEYIEEAEKQTPGRSRTSRNADANQYWDLGCGFDNAIKMAREGWDEGEQFTKRYSAGLFESLSTVVEREYPVYDVEGTEIDIARFMDGEPECWQRMETRVTEGTGRKLIRIVLNMATSGGVSGATMLAKGAAIAALAELLEFAGHGVQIDLVDGTSAGGMLHIETWIRIKDFDQPIDLPRVAFALAHPATQRRLWFAMAENFPADIYQAVVADQSYGRPADINEQDRGDVYIGRSMYPAIEWSNEGIAQQWVLEQLRRQGVVLKEQE